MHGSWKGPKPDFKDMDKRLADMGNAGWELAGTVPNTPGTQAPILLIFKRPKT